MDRNEFARYQIILAYDGSLFQGFQRQANTRTVQGVFETALRELGWQQKSILSAGRTDTGVHALGQVVAFDLRWNHSTIELRNALNAHLPPDTSVLQVNSVPLDFHPRYWAVKRQYRYHLFCQEMRNPILERFAWRVWPIVEESDLQDAASILVGKYDFSAFGSPTRPHGSTVRTIMAARWHKQAEELIFEITADAFLYHMVRRLVFVQVQAAQGRWSLQDIRLGLMETKPQMPGLAPPNGLKLFGVEYPPFRQEDDLSSYAEGSLNNSLALSGEDDRGQDIRP